MQSVAVGALLISRTGQATWAVLVAAAAFLPLGLLSPIGGALADRLPRRPVLIGGNLAATAVALALAALVASGHDAPGLLVGLVAVQGAASAVIGPFQQAILPDLVPQSEFLPAIALNSAQFNLGRIAGPALAGAAVAAFGYPVASWPMPPRSWPSWWRWPSSRWPRRPGGTVTACWAPCATGWGRLGPSRPAGRPSAPSRSSP